MTNYISTTDVAKLIRKALKESFPGVKFSVRSHSYSGGSSIDIGWTDGPNSNQVDTVVKTFEGSYFDGMTDYKGVRSHMMDGEPVSFGVDFIFTNREFSDELVQKSIDAIWNKYLDNWEDAGISKPSVDDYRTGRLMDVRDPNMHITYAQSMHNDVATNMSKRSTVVEPAPSPTLDRVQYMGDDGYGYNATGKIGLKVVR